MLLCNTLCYYDVLKMPKAHDMCIALCNKVTNQATNRAANQAGSQSASQAANKATNQTANQAASKAASQATTQAANQRTASCLSLVGYLVAKSNAARRSYNLGIFNALW